MSSHIVEQTKSLIHVAGGGASKAISGIGSLVGSIGVAEKIVPVVVPAVTCIFFILSVCIGWYFKIKESRRLERIADETIESLRHERCKGETEEAKK